MAADDPVADATGGETGTDPVGVVRAFRESLASVDVAGLSDEQRLDLVAELERVKGASSAAQARATHAVRCSVELRSPQDAVRSVGAMVALARRQSPALGDRFVGVARALVTELPHTFAALEAGVCSERHVVEVVQQCAVLGVAERGVLDERVGPLLGRLGVKGVAGAARRVAAELDAASVVARMEAAVRSRRVTVRPAPDGMAYLSVLGPMKDVVGAFAALQVRSRSVVGGQCPDEAPQGRGVGAVAADTALELLSGRAPGQVQPVEVHLVMTDRALLGSGDPDRSVFEPARIPGHGSVPAPVARAWLRAGLDGPPAGADASDPTGEPGHPSATGRAAARPPQHTGAPSGARAPGATSFTRSAAAASFTGPGAATSITGTAVGGASPARVWLRRLYTSPDGRDLVAMDSRRRLFSGLLRRMLVLRDDVCTTAWCEAPIVHADHTTPAREGGMTSYQQGSGKCARCNQVKEAPGWRHRVKVLQDPRGHECGGRHDGELWRRVVQVTTPLGHRYVSEPPPLLGWGSATAPSANGRTVVGENLRVPPEARPRPTSERNPMPRSEPNAAPRSEPKAAPRNPTPADGWTCRGPGYHPKRALRRREWVPNPAPRRPRLTSHLERELCRYLT